MSSGCGTVARAASSDTRDPWFELCHWQFLFTLQMPQIKINLSLSVNQFRVFLNEKV